MDPDEQVDEEFVCKFCAEATVVVVTKALHTSECVYIVGEQLVACNSDSSWSTPGDKQRFSCVSCGKSWPCKEEIIYDWVY